MLSRLFCLAQACVCVCVSKYIHISFNPVCLNVCECVFAHMPAGLGNRWRLGANSADAGVENPAVELRLRGESAAGADWGPGWSTDVMEPAFFPRTSLSPTACRSDCCPSVALTAACLSARSHFLRLLSRAFKRSLPFHRLSPGPLRLTKPERL